MLRRTEYTEENSSVASERVREASGCQSTCQSTGAS